MRAVSDPQSAIDTARYIVGAMMTPSHARFGERLAASLYKCTMCKSPLGCVLFGVSVISLYLLLHLDCNTLLYHTV